MSLYDPKLERDNCGFGLLAHMEGEASHKLVRLAMSALARMQHRGGISADGKTGDGCGLLLQNRTASSELSPRRRDGTLAATMRSACCFSTLTPYWPSRPATS